MKNSGDRDGDEVVQVYIKNNADKSLNKTMRAFRRIHLKKGEAQDVTFELGPEAFAFYNPESGEMEAIAGEYEIGVGGASDNVKSLKIKY